MGIGDRAGIIAPVGKVGDVVVKGRRLSSSYQLDCCYSTTLVLDQGKMVGIKGKSPSRHETTPRVV